MGNSILKTFLWWSLKFEVEQQRPLRFSKFIPAVTEGCEASGLKYVVSDCLITRRCSFCSSCLYTSSCHHGIFKLWEPQHRLFFWPQMRSAVKNFLNSCRKTATSRTQMRPCENKFYFKAITLLKLQTKWRWIVLQWPRHSRVRDTSTAHLGLGWLSLGRNWDFQTGNDQLKALWIVWRRFLY